jgi:hypothetical protein
MGFFITAGAGILVVLQTTLLLLHRPATSTDFTLMRKQTAVNGTRLWARTTPVHIEPVLSSWQPHVLLLAIACVHCVIALQTYRSKSPPNATGLLATATPMAPVGFFLLWLTVALIDAYTVHMLEPSTWVAGCCLFAAVGLAQQRTLEGLDMLWTLIFELQAVSVPLTVLLMAYAGVLSYTDIALHFLLLSAAVNTLWLQLILHGSALYMAKLLTVAIPAISLYLSQASLQHTHITAAMGGIIALAPLFIMPVILNTDDPTTLRAGVTLDKFQFRLGSLCCSGALLCTIINLAAIYITRSRNNNIGYAAAAAYYCLLLLLLLWPAPTCARCGHLDAPHAE